jgi:hypothetical protein
MKKLMHILMLSCKKATFLIEKGNNNPLSFMDKLQLTMHLKMCNKCADYQKQSILIENVLKSNHVIISNPSNFKLSDTTKLRIQKAINENLK